MKLSKRKAKKIKKQEVKRKQKGLLTAEERFKIQDEIQLKNWKVNPKNKNNTPFI